MQRYFIPPERLVSGKAVIEGNDARHLALVMRARVGDRIVVSDGRGRTVLAEIAELDKTKVTATVIEPLPADAEPAVHVWIAQSLPKGDKMETVIQKCTEIGATRIIPFLSERTVVRYNPPAEEKRLQRWRKIAKEAAEQAHRDKVPEIEAPMTWKQLLQAASDADAALFCYERENGRTIGEQLKRLFSREAEKPVRTVLIVVGPEGGFTEREAREAEAAGIVPVSMGRRILRAETAGMVALACILYEAGEMGG
jgi:16S rRNA (uracil1498-N3)-methyltransferase